MDTYKDIILNISGLEIGYITGRKKQSLLYPVSARAGRGEIIAVIGRNGAGKSTLLRTLAGLQPGLGGHIDFRQRPLSGYTRKELARNVGYVSTEPVRVANMTAWDLVALGRFPYTNWIGRIGGEDSRMIEESLEQTSMINEKDKYLSEMSDGERQKVMIARMLAQDADLMILDEPSAFLDAGSRYEILNILHRLSSARGKTVIYSTHDLQMALSQSDKIWLIAGGKLKEGSPEDLMIDGSLSELFESPEVHFNPADGTFSIREKIKGHICIEGEGIVKYWTAKAIKRAGFSVTGKKGFPTVRVPNDDQCIWYYDKGDKILSFSNLYEFVYYLRNSAD
ncbi:MAG TPA: ABC transporter ATP-binding protein [Bacteroidales bacterium]|nr:ABC transporter ATP-binding protein [Bacteroidales bacterium]